MKYLIILVLFLISCDSQVITNKLDCKYEDGKKMCQRKYIKTRNPTIDAYYESCVDGVTYISKNGYRRSLTVKLDTNSKIIPCVGDGSTFKYKKPSNYKYIPIGMEN